MSISKIIEEPQKKRDWIDFLTPMSLSKKHLIDEDPEYESAYKPYMVNRNFSNFQDTVMLVNEMNQYPNTDPRMQHDFLFYTMDKRKRWSGKWGKRATNEAVEVIQEYFGYSYVKATKAAECLTEAQIQTMKEHLSEGGVKKK